MCQHAEEEEAFIRGLERRRKQDILDWAEKYPDAADQLTLGTAAVVPKEPTREMKARVRENGGLNALAYGLACWPYSLDAAPKLVEE